MTLPYVKTSPTSADAALRAEPRAGTDRARVLQCLRGFPDGLTDEQMAEFLTMNPSTLRPRRIELQNRNLVRDSGRTRRTRSGRSAVVWVAT